LAVRSIEKPITQLSSGTCITSVSAGLQFSRVVGQGQEARNPLGFFVRVIRLLISTET